MVIDERKAWAPTSIMTVIGPGAAGKSSLGLALAPIMNRTLIDLDEVFNRRIGHIGNFIRSRGYKEYKTRNSRLAQDLVASADSPILLITSSGFLTPDNPLPALQANTKLVEGSYSICLLPSLDVERSVEIIVQRQMTRTFSSTREREEATIRTRHPIYTRLGDLGVFSSALPSEIAAVLASRFLS